MSKGIRISEKYGVNPAIPLCFFCCEKKNEIILPGKSRRGDEQSPQNHVWDMAPCDKCKEFMSKGIILISVSDDSEETISDAHLNKDMPNPNRTGGWWVVTDDFVKRVVTTPELLKDLLKRRWTFIPDKACDHLGLQKVGAE